MTTKELVCATIDEAEQAIRARRPFRLRSGSTLRAVTEPPEDTGLLPDDMEQGLRYATYVVISYGTPIAWIEADSDVFIPDVGYSPSTSQHQYAAAHALRVDFRPARNQRTVSLPRLESQYGRPRRLRRGGIDGSGDEWYGSEDSMNTNGALKNL